MLVLNRHRPFARVAVGLALTVLVATAAAPEAGAQVINEFVANHTGSDNREFLEVFGTPSTNYSALTLIQLEGDTADNPGVLDSAFTVGTTNSDGYWYAGFYSDVLEDGSKTFLLVSGYDGTGTGTDLDTDNDGTLDIVPWTGVVDGVAVLFLGAPASDRTYATPVLTPNWDGFAPYEPGGASRIPNGVDTGSPSDWVRADWEGEGLPGLTGFVITGEAWNTPGGVNSAPLPKINEFVLDHTGTDTAEYIEVAASALVNHAAYTVLAIDGDGADAGIIDFVATLGATDANGYWTTGALNEVLENGSQTLLLVKNFSGAQGQDLDTDNDGVLDLAPWDAISDAVAADDGDGDHHYAATVLTVRGASRIPDGIDTDTPADWVENDFEGDGLGLGGPAATTEAINTRGRSNRQTVAGYYAGVTGSSPGALKAAVHEVIDDHKRIPYSANATDTWDVLNVADTNPSNPGQLLTVYKNEALGNSCSSACSWQREHTWPKSYGFPDDDDDSYPYTDCHHLRPAMSDYNGARLNHPFGDCDAACAEYVTVANNGFGGVGGAYPGDSDWLDGAGRIWEVWNHRRGDIARAMFYMDVRYEGGAHGVTLFKEPDLRLTDNLNLIYGGNLYMGRRSVLLEWHEADPVDDEERARNQAVYAFQGNRNPFVDHPEWVGCIYQNLSCPLFVDGFEAGDASQWSGVVP